MLPGQVLSWVFSTLSNVAWLFVFVPQIVENWLNCSSNAVSFYLVLLWYIGDTLSVTSTMYKTVSDTLIYVGLYHIIFDVIFLFQIIFYRLPGFNRYPLLLNETNFRYEIIDYIRTVVFMEEVLTFLSYHVFLFIVYPLLYWTSQNTIGDILAWSSTVIFLSSRLPQIWLNYTRKSVDGLSFVTFINILVANMLFLLSVLSPLIDQANEQDARIYFITNLPWIIGSSSTGVFDIIMLTQFYIYN